MKLEESIKEGMHAELSKLVGNWKGVTKVWFGPELADESAVQGSMKSVLGGRFILHEYSRTFQSKGIEGMAIYGYDLAQEKFQTAWIDSFHMSTAIMLSEGKGDSLSALGHYETLPPEVQRWRWRTEIQVVDAVIITMYNISPTGEESKAVEITYQRIQ